MTELEQKLLKALKASLEFEWVGQGAKARMEEAERIVMDAEAAQTAADADGWISWPGGMCPVAAGTLVDVRFRNGFCLLGVPAEVSLYGPYEAKGAYWRNDDMENDIIAYRVVKYPRNEHDKAEQLAELQRRLDEIEKEQEK